MKSLNLNMDRYTTPTTDAPHELSEAVNLIEAAGLFTATFNRGYWLKKVSAARFDHPVDEVKTLLKKMKDLKVWLLETRREYMNCGAWLTNRLKELAAGPITRAAAEGEPKLEASHQSR